MNKLEALTTQPPIELDAIEALKDVPPRHYLTGLVTVRNDKKALEATAFFPSSDESIGSRGHVNTTHFMDGMWNAAHVLADVNDFTYTRAISGSYENLRELRPDVPVQITVEIADYKMMRNIVEGQLKTTYSLNESPVAQLDCHFFARKKR